MSKRCSRIFLSIRLGSRRQAGVARPFAGVKQLFEAMKQRSMARRPELRLRADQGASRSRQQDPARRGPHRGIQCRTEQRRPRPVVGCRICRRSSASTTPTAPNSAFPTSSAFGATPRIPSCAISSVACRTMQRPKRRRRSRKSAGSRRCASISWWLSDDRLAVHGRLSTHVLDTHSGKPAAGIAVELVELSALGESRVVTRTDHQSPTAAPTSR